jgi:D-alanyl-D-alanine carboxypeptidase
VQRRSRKRGKTQQVSRKSRYRSRPNPLRRLRIWMVVLLLLATAAVAGTGFYFWYHFSEPFRLAAERNEEESGDSLYENHDDLPTYDDSFNLVLVNSENRLSDTFEVTLTTVDGVEVETRIAPYLQAMMEAAKADGVDLQLLSGYVSRETQEERYQQEIKRLMKSGLSRMKAEDTANRTVGDGGYSEYQTGMAVDFTSSEKGDFQSTAAYRWLMSNSIHYGFVLRYPEGKTSQTKMEYDPSHFRFVGVKHATRMQELNLCLEEYASYVKLQP